MDFEQLTIRKGFRQRGHDMTRIEAFTDAAFAIAASLMVISLSDVPTSWSQLVAALQGIPAFALALLVMMLFWYGHHVWSRRFGLDDLSTVCLSGLLIFQVLVYVYPLKLMANIFMTWVSRGAVESPAQLNSLNELYALFAVYSAGFMLMALTIVLLYIHAWRVRVDLRLNAVERMTTRHEIVAWLLLAVFGLASFLIALCVPPSRVPWPGIAMGGLAIVMPIFGQWSSKRIMRAIRADGAD